MRIACSPARLPRKASSRLQGGAVIRRYVEGAAAIRRDDALLKSVTQFEPSRAVIAQDLSRYDAYMTDKWRLRVSSEIFIGLVRLPHKINDLAAAPRSVTISRLARHKWTAWV
jgi:hypothetical protein